MKQRLCATLIACTALSLPAAAQSVFPSGALIGTVAGASSVSGNGNFCYIESGASNIQRNRLNNTVVMTLPSGYVSASGYGSPSGLANVPLAGEIALTFSSGSSGSVAFSAPGSPSGTTFSGYSQTLTGSTYSVHYTLSAPGCRLNINSAYMVAP